MSPLSKTTGRTHPGRTLHHIAGRTLSDYHCKIDNKLVSDHHPPLLWPLGPRRLTVTHSRQSCKSGISNAGGQVRGGGLPECTSRQDRPSSLGLQALSGRHDPLLLRRSWPNSRALSTTIELRIAARSVCYRPWEDRIEGPFSEAFCRARGARLRSGASFRRCRTEARCWFLGCRLLRKECL